MVNSIPTLMTVADCDHQLELAATALIAMQYERSRVDQKNFEAVTKGPDFEEELETTQELIAIFEESLTTMAEGPGKKDLTAQLQKLYVTRNTLLRKEDNYGLDGLFEQQGEYIALGGKITAYETYIAALNARKAEL